MYCSRGALLIGGGLEGCDLLNESVHLTSWFGRGLKHKACHGWCHVGRESKIGTGSSRHLDMGPPPCLTF